MISQEYLTLLDSVGASLKSNTTDINLLLEDVSIEWEWLQKYWSNSPEDTRTAQTLQVLAGIGYQIVFQLTGKSTQTLIQEAKELHAAKNAGYSGSSEDCWLNFRGCEVFGISAVNGAVTRLCDKYTRFQNVYKNSILNQVNESAIDTMIDFSAYCLIVVCLLSEQRNTES